jgi:hypothetical protein
MKEASSFWESVPLEEIAAQQGVSAVDDLDEISALWPNEDDPDEVFQHVFAERAGRRELGENRGNAT